MKQIPFKCGYVIEVTSLGAEFNERHKETAVHRQRITRLSLANKIEVERHESKEMCKFCQGEFTISHVQDKKRSNQLCWREQGE